MENTSKYTKQKLFEMLVASLSKSVEQLDAVDIDTALFELLRFHKKRLFQAKGKIRCGFWVQQNAAINHLFELMHALAVYEQIEVLAIMDGAEAAADPQWLLESKWLEVPLLVCGENEFCQLNELDVLFIQESNFELSFNWPTKLIRIGCQHGIDVKLSKTLVEYGGCLEFDYVLTPKPDDCPNIDEYSGYFPKALRQASTGSVTTIPFGSIKFDKFYQAYKQCEQTNTAIIYHLSNLALEYPWVLEQLEPTITFLLATFPNHEIVFRPFPEDFKHPKIKSIVRHFSEESRFTFSQTPSYISDYCRGVAMVCHRQYESHLFPLVTGQPMLVFQPVDEGQITRNSITSFGELAMQLKTAINNASKHKTQLSGSGVVCNPGNSVDYLVNNLRRILEGSRLPEWKQYNLDLVDSVDKCMQQNQCSYRPFNKLALAAWKKFPDNVEYAFIAAESLSRRTKKEFEVNPGLAHLYLRKAISVISTSKDLHKAEEKRFATWMKEQGAFVLGALEVLGDRLGKPLNDNERLLIKEFGTKKSPTIPSLFKQRHTVLSCHDGQIVAATGPVILYGSGELTCQFIAQQKIDKTYQIAAVVDSSPSRHGKRLEGFIIDKPSILTNLNFPIVICSVAFSQEIYSFLRRMGIAPNQLFKLF